jgi:RHS repeat-associated protein
MRLQPSSWRETIQRLRTGRKRKPNKKKNRFQRRPQLQQLEPREMLAMTQVIDDGDSGYSTVGTWTDYSTGGYQGDLDYLPGGSGANKATWTFNGLTSGEFRVSATWAEHSNRATNSSFTISDGAALLSTVYVNQELAPQADETDSGVNFQHLGNTVNLAGDTLVVELSDDANEYVIADAIGIERIGDIPTGDVTIMDDGDGDFSATSGWIGLASLAANGDDYSFAGPSGTGSEQATWTFSGLTAGQSYRVSATWPAHANRATDSPFSVNGGAAILVNQELAPDDLQDAGHWWEDLGAFQPDGSGDITVTLTDDANEYVVADGIRIEDLGAAEIHVEVGGTSLTDGSSTVDYGTTDYGTTVTKTYTVKNVGGDTLTLTGVTVPNGYTLTSPLSDTSLDAWETATFDVRFDAGDFETTSGSVSIANDDSDESPFDFSVTGDVETTYIVDDGDPDFQLTSGGWAYYTGQGFGGDVYAAPAGSGSSTATWTLDGMPAGTVFRVSVTWTVNTNRATNAPYEITGAEGGPYNFAVNQELAPADLYDQATYWEDLANVAVDSNGLLAVELTDNANEYVVADAIRFEALTGPKIQVAVDGQNLDDGTGVADFGKVVRSLSETKTFTVTNTGLGNVTISDPDLPAGFVLESGVTGLSLAFGETDSFDVKFVDTASLGVKSGQTTVTFNDGQEDNDYTFTAQGEAILGHIIDDGGPGYSAPGWVQWNLSGYQGDLDYRAAGSGSYTATWTLGGLDEGDQYRVHVTWVEHPNRATNSPFTINGIEGGPATHLINQELAPDDLTEQSTNWETLQTVEVDSGGQLSVTLNNNANENVIADAVMFEPITAMIMGPASVDEAATYRLDLHALGFTATGWTVNWGDGTEVYPAGTDTYVEHTYADGDNQYTVTASAGDGTDTFAADAVTVDVDNVAPTLTLSGNSTAVTSTPYTLNLSESDPGDDTIQNWTITWGDGSSPETVSGNPSSAQHTYSQFGTSTITATATDEDGTFSAGNSVEVTANTPPTVQTSMPDLTGDKSTFLYVTLGDYFTDADLPADSLTYSAVSTNPNLLVVVGIDAGELTLGLSGAQCGSGAITVTAKDSVGATVSDSFMVIVNTDPPTGGSNLYPTIKEPIGSFGIEAVEGGAPADTTIDVSSVFTDPDANPLVITSTFSAGGTIDDASVSNNQLTIEYTGNVGSTDLTLTADDLQGGTVSFDFTVNVYPDLDSPAGIPVVSQSLGSISYDRTTDTSSSLYAEMRIDLHDHFDNSSGTNDDLSFTVADVTDSGLFTVATVVEDSGTPELLLHYAPRVGATETVHIVIEATDDTNGLSVRDTLEVNIDNVNFAPEMIENNYSWSQAATNEIQEITTGSATGGTFTLSFGAETTTDLAYDASGATIDSALEALSSIGANNLNTLAGSDPWQFEFTGDLGSLNVTMITIDGANLVGGSPSVTLIDEGGQAPDPFGYFNAPYLLDLDLEDQQSYDDNGVVWGVALYDLDTTLGTLEFSTNGTTWTAIPGTLQTGEAFVILPTDQLRLNPDPSIDIVSPSGETRSPLFSYHAWDQWKAVPTDPNSISERTISVDERGLTSTIGNDVATVSLYIGPGGDQTSNAAPLPDPYMTTPVPSTVFEAAGGERLINIYDVTVDTSVRPQVAMAENGEYVAIWSGTRDYGGDGQAAQTGLFGQRFYADGTPHANSVNTPFLIKSGATYYQSLAVNNTHTVVSVDDYVYVYDNDSQWSVDHSIQMPTYGAQVDMNESGRFLVTWESSSLDKIEAAIYEIDIYGQVSQIGSNITVATATGITTGHHVVDPDVGVADDGRFVVTWLRDDNNDPESFGVQFQRYDSSGAPVGSATYVPETNPYSDHSPRITVSDYGYFTVGWSNYGLDKSYAQQYDSSGATTASLIEQSTDGFSFTGRDDGSLLMTYEDPLLFFVRVIESDGTQADGFVTYEEVPGGVTSALPTDYSPEIAGNGGGRFVAVWFNEDDNLVARAFRPITDDSNPTIDVASTGQGRETVGTYPVSVEVRTGNLVFRPVAAPGSLAGGLLPVYRDLDSSILEVEGQIPAGGTVPDQITAKLIVEEDFNVGVFSETIVFDTTGLQAGDTFVMPFKMSDVGVQGLDTGRYGYTVDVTSLYADGTVELDTISEVVELVDREDSPFGEEWWLEGLYRLLIPVAAEGVGYRPRLEKGWDIGGYHFIKTSENGTAEWAWSSLDGGHDVHLDWPSFPSLATDAQLELLVNSSVIDTQTIDLTATTSYQWLASSFTELQDLDSATDVVTIRLSGGTNGYLLADAASVTRTDGEPVSPEHKYRDDSDVPNYFTTTDDWREFDQATYYDGDLDDPDSGLLLVRGNGTTAWFDKPFAPGLTSSYSTQFGDEINFAYETPEGSFVNLVQHGVGSATEYHLRHTGGSHDIFNQFGLLLRRVDPYGNEVVFEYEKGDVSPADPEFDDRLVSITDAFGQKTQFDYDTAGEVTITDFAGLDTVYELNSQNQVVSITYPDPDADPGTSNTPKTTFEYTAGPLSKVTTPRGNDPSDPAYQTFTEINHSNVDTADGETWSLDPVQHYGLVTNPDPETSYPLYKPEDRIATLTDQRTHDWTYKTDHFGYVTSMTAPAITGFPSGSETVYERNDDGLVTKLIEPVGAGGTDNFATTLDTVYTYVADQPWLVESITYADTESESREYDPVFGVATEHTDLRGFKTTVELDGFGSPILSRRINGLDDTQSSETDDLVSRFAYSTRSLSGSNVNLPGGLLTTSVDLRGFVTTTDYFDYGESTTAVGLVEKITGADGSSDESVQTFTYDARRNPLTVTQHVTAGDRTTTTDYDELDRLVQVTLPFEYHVDPPLTEVTDPDNATVQYQPISYFKYNTEGQRIEESHRIDAVGAIGKTTNWTFDAMGRLEKTELPASDNYNPLTEAIETGIRPTTINQYDEVGNLVGIKDPLFNHIDDGVPSTPTGAETILVHNDRNWLIEEHRPDPGSGDYVGVTIIKTRYDSAGNVKETETTKNSQTRITQYEYDERHRKDLERLPEADHLDAGGSPISTSPETTWQYDEAGNVRFINAPLSRTTELQYNDLGWLTKTILPAVAAGVVETTYQRDLAGNAIATTDPESNTTVAGFDGLGRNNVTILPASGTGQHGSPVTRRTFNEAGQVLELDNSFDGVTRKTTNVYDNLGRLSTSTLPDVEDRDTGTFENPVTTFRYDVFGNQRLAQDAEGNYTETLYDELDRVHKTIEPDPDALGGSNTSETTVSYDVNGQVREVDDPLNRKANFEYDTLGRKTKELLPPDQHGIRPETNWHYDEVDNVWYVEVKVRDTAHQNDSFTQQTYFEYDDLDRLTKTIEHYANPSEANPETELKYDEASRLVRQFDPLDWQSDFEYNLLDQLTKTTYPLLSGEAQRAESTTQYDRVGNVLFETNRRGFTTEFQRDDLYRTSAVVTPPASHYDPSDPAADANGMVTKSTTTSFVYDAGGRQREAIDALGRTTKTEYDKLNRVIEVNPPQAYHLDDNGDSILTQPTVFVKYDLVGNKVKQINVLGEPDDDPNRPQFDAEDETTEWQFDYQHRLKKRIDPAATPGGTNPEYAFTYDKADQLLTETDPQQRTTTHTPDNLGRVIETLHPDPPSAEYQMRTYVEYDLVSNVLKEATVFGAKDDDPSRPPGDPDDEFVSYAHDNLHRLKTETIGNITPARKTIYTHDLNGFRETMKDPEGNITTYVPDEWNRVKEEQITVDSQTLSRTWEYDHEGNVEAYEDRNGNLFQSTYDELNRKTDEYWFVNGLETNHVVTTYDVANRLHSISDTSSSYTYSYDNLDRVNGVLNTGTPGSPNVVLAMQFDDQGRRRTLSATIDGVADFQNTYNYNDRGYFTEIVQQGQGGNAVAYKRIDFTYDDADQYDTIKRYASTGTSQLVAESTFTFDLDQRLEDLEHLSGSASVLAHYTWTYDEKGRVDVFDSSVDGSADYDYDEQDQLTVADYDGYQTDENYTYDDNGNRTITGYSTGDHNRLSGNGTYTYEYDENGNLTRRIKTAGGMVTDYTWDARNRLVQVTDYPTVADADAEQNATQAVYFTYDVYNLRIGKRVETLDPGSGLLTLDSEHRYVLDGESIVLRFDGSTGDDLTNRYLWGQQVDQIFADEEVDDLLNPGDVVWPLTDNLGTVRDLAEYDGNDTSVVNHIVYDAFGNITSQTDAEAADHIFYFTGQEFDDETGLYYYNQRYYDSATARFLSPDPIQDDHVNPYRYVGNDPTNKVDPSGLEDLKKRWSQRQALLKEAAGLTKPPMLPNRDSVPPPEQSFARSWNRYWHAFNQIYFKKNVSPTAKRHTSHELIEQHGWSPSDAMATVFTEELWRNYGLGVEQAVEIVTIPVDVTKETGVTVYEVTTGDLVDDEPLTQYNKVVKERLKQDEHPLEISWDISKEHLKNTGTLFTRPVINGWVEYGETGNADNLNRAGGGLAMFLVPARSSSGFLTPKEFTPLAPQPGTMHINRNTPPTKLAATNNESIYTFRGDTRPPTTIFRDGFQHRGTSLDLFEYTESNVPSVYVGTSRSMSRATELVADQAMASGTDGFVYLVRIPRGRGIDVNQALGSRSPYPYEVEVVVPGGIQAVEVVGGWNIQQVGDNVIIVKNPNYAGQ